ncbi:hypothetical protein Q4525_04405 [Shimia thalassica]|uniref:hypothetical protein n=1 Tax=Shimia thalassica TaxID=1715693 RepID=UPI001C081AAD|nr:hypothetical protein [Shimia thalassica]MBU2944501.1 hypothetical protein [Shimia thalassica]MDO6502153.1 hypothetical protein [Shimia thalassica]
MRNLLCAIFVLVFSFQFTAVQAQQFSVPEKPNKQAMFKKNGKINKRSLKGYLGIQSVILAPLGDDSYAVLYGSLAGKRNGDSFHYFENADLGFVCVGTGKPTQQGGVVSNECFLNGGSTGKESIVVPDFGKLSGKMVFDVYDNGHLIGPAAMQWGLTYPSHKKMYKYLKNNGG